MLINERTRLYYRNERAGELSFAPLGDFWITQMEEQLKNQIHAVKQANQHGKYGTGMSLDERYITLTGHVSQRYNTEQATNLLQRVFNPTLGGILVYERGKDRKEISCKVEELPKVYWSSNALRFDVNLVCLSPFWSGKDIIEYIAETIKQFKFKLAIPEGGMSFGTRLAVLESRFENAGNVESGFKATIRATHGTVLNPEIKNISTNERIRVLYNMQKYDIIEITSNLQVKKITINGSNGFKYLNAENSTFFSLDVGTNRIGYFADENISNMEVNVKYTPNYTHAEVF